MTTITAYTYIYLSSSWDGAKWCDQHVCIFASSHGAYGARSLLSSIAFLL